jgi:heptosyltransferase-3
VVALPCLHAIAKRFKGQEIVVLTNRPVSDKAPSLKSIISKAGLVSRVLEYGPLRYDIRKACELIGAVLRLRPSSVVLLSPKYDRMSALRERLFFKALGCRKLVTTPSIAELRPKRDPRTGVYEREAERLLRCIGELGCTDLSNASNWDLRLTQEERDEAGQIVESFGNRPFIAIGPGGKAAENDWGSGRWREALDLISMRLPELCLVIVGALSERDRFDGLVSAWRGPAVNAAGILQPRSSAALLQKAVLFVGHDSGPLHLAAAMQVRCVGLYGNRNPPNRWHPCGNGHRILHSMRGVQAINVSVAVREICAALGSVVVPNGGEVISSL